MENETKKGQILQVCRLTPLWGMDLYSEISKALKQDDTEVTTVFLCGHTNLELCYPGEIIFLELNRRSLFWRFQAFFKLLSLSQKKKFDIVICHDYKPMLLMYFVSFFARLGKCYSVHHNFGNFRRSTAQWFLQRFKKKWYFLPVSNGLKKEFLSLHIPEKQIKTLQNAIDIDNLRTRQFTRETARIKMGLSEEAFIFGTLGRLVPAKGHDRLIEAFRQSNLLKGKPIKLVIIGTGQLEEKLKKQIADHHLAENVLLITACAHEGARYLKAFDVFVFPSVVEPFGIAVLEALCAELPIIASTTGGIPEAAGPHSTLIPPGDMLALTHAMEKYYALSETKRNHLGKQGLDFLTNTFSLANYHQRVRTALDLS